LIAIALEMSTSTQDLQIAEAFIQLTVERPGETFLHVSYRVDACALHREVKGHECKVDHSSPADAEVKKAWIYTSTPPTPPSWYTAYLSARTILTFTL
jgi:hypothetical protein